MKARGIFSSIILGGALVLSQALSSCSGEAPVLQNIRAVQIQRQAPEGKGYSLSVFAAVQDSDGFEDIEALYIVKDEEELFWKLDPESWTKKDIEGSAWIGSNGISLAGSEAFPEGSYRLIIVDAAGEKAEREFNLDKAGWEGLSLKANLEGDKLDIVGSSALQSFQILFLDASGRTLFTVDGKKGSQSISQICAQYQEYSIAHAITVLALHANSRQALMSQRLSLK